MTLSGASSIGLSYTSFGLTLIGGLTPSEPSVVRRIVDHLRKHHRPARPPPPRVHQPVASPV